MIDDNKCMYPDWEEPGNYIISKHRYGKDQDFCIICGHPSKSWREKRKRKANHPHTTIFK